jgi:hypothetical protein
MAIADLHLQVHQQGKQKPIPERWDVRTLQYYLDRLNYAKSWQALAVELNKPPIKRI